MPTVPTPDTLLEALPADGVAAALEYATDAAVDVTYHHVGDADHVVIIDHAPGREMTLVDLEYLLPAPRDARGYTNLHDPASLVEWVNLHRAAAVDVYANPDHLNLAVVLDPHRPGRPSWQRHIGACTIRHHPRYARWRALDGKLVDQAAFAEHVQICASDVVTPAALDLLEVAETLQLNVGARISSSHRLRDGSRRLVFDETVDAVAGVDHEVEVPERITLRLPVYEGGDPTDVQVRVMYRKAGQGVAFLLQIVDRLELERALFDAAAQQVALDLDASLLFGTPATVAAHESSRL